jgi:hypothetical protein
MLKKIPIYLEISALKDRSTVQMDKDVLLAAKELANDINVPLGVLVTNCVHEYLRKYNYDVLYAPSKIWGTSDFWGNDENGKNSED